MLAHICASVHYEAIGDGEQSRACLRDVASTVDHLADWPKSIDAKWARAMYFYQTGREKAILDDFREGAKQGRAIRTYEAVLSASILYRDHEIEQALAALDWAANESTRSGVASFARAYIEMERIASEAERTAMAKRYIERALDRRERSTGIYLYFDWTVLTLLGDPLGAKDMAMQFRDACQNTEIWRPWLPIADFMLGNCPEEDLLTTYPDHKGRHTMAEFAIAIASLSRDNRDAAREHFQAVRTANISGMYTDYWSRAFLERLEGPRADPHWLPWLRKAKLPCSVRMTARQIPRGGPLWRA